MTRDDVIIGDLRLSVTGTGDGRPFVFLHGLCGNAAQPLEVCPENGGWRYLALECRGHGHSGIGALDELSIRRFADDAAEYLSSLGTAPVVIGGISMGAAIALRLAATRPGLASGLVLARPAWVDQPAPPTLEAHRRIAALMAEHDAAAARRLFAESDLARAVAVASPDNLSSLLGFFDRQPTDQTRALLAAIGHDGPGVSRREIAGIDIPTLVIGTDKDIVHPMAMAETLAGLIPRASLVRITPKSDDRQSYVAEFRAAIGDFLGGF